MLAKIVEKFATGVVDTGAVVHFDLQISLQIFEKIWNGLNGILWGWGKLIHGKKQKQKISWHCPFKKNEFVGEIKGTPNRQYRQYV